MGTSFFNRVTPVIAFLAMLAVAGCTGAGENGVATNVTETTNVATNVTETTNVATNVTETTNVAPDSEPVTLAYTDFYGPGSFFGDAHAWWMAEVEKRSGGSITFEAFWSGSLISAPEALPGIGQGRADVGFVGQAYYPVDLPLANAGYLPMFSTDVDAMARAYAYMYDNSEVFQAEWAKQNVIPVAWSPVAPMGLGSITPIESIADFKDTIVRSSGLQTIAYEAFGAQTAAIASNETYEALQRGTINAWGGLTIDGTAAMGFPEVAPNLLAFPELYTVIGAPIVINLDTWEKLDEAQQQAIHEASRAYQQVAIEMAMSYEAEGCRAYLDAGGVVTMFPDDERLAFMAEVAPAMTSHWYETALQSGLERSVIDDFVGQLFDAYNRFSEESAYKDGFVACKEMGS